MYLIRSLTNLTDMYPMPVSRAAAMNTAYASSIIVISSTSIIRLIDFLLSPSILRMLKYPFLVLRISLMTKYDTKNSAIIIIIITGSIISCITSLMLCTSTSLSGSGTYPILLSSFFVSSMLSLSFTSTVA